MLAIQRKAFAELHKQSGYRNRRQKLRMTLICAIRHYEIIQNMGSRTGLIGIRNNSRDRKEVTK